MVVNVFFSAVTQATLSRHELLAWVNDCLQSNLTKIEEMATGAAYCGLTDLLFPGSCQLKKVKWNSRHKVDWINNWRVLQGSWKQLGVDKPVPVEKLLKAKFQENFEFLQWFKKFYDANYVEHEYDAVSARGGEEFPAVLPGGKAPPPARVAPRPAASTRAAIPSTTRRSGVTAPQKPAAAVAQKTASVTQKAPTSNNSNGAASGVNIAAIEEKYKKQLEELIQENAALAESVTGLEKERDFYFNKLRAVEILCTEIGEDAHVETKRITNILYETEDGYDSEVVEEQADIPQQESPIPPSAEVQEHTNGKTNGHSTHDEKEITPKEEKVHDVNDVAQKAGEINLDDSETF